jgi:hypothetical protein
VPEELFWLTYLVSPPVQTATHHIFCQDCLSRALARFAVCPVTRRPLRDNATDIQPLNVANPIMHRIWSKVLIRCPNALGGVCKWQGGPGDLEPHFQGCPGRVDAMAVAEVRRELASEREAAKVREGKLKETTEALQALHTEFKNLRAEFKRRTAFDATYSYGRERIVELAQVIMRDLESSPPEINTNRIFDCVRNINRDWERKFSDNPKHMGLDFPMLLAVCRASTWFSDKQRAQMLNWWQSAIK